MMKKAGTVILMIILVLTSVILINTGIENAEAASITVPTDYNTVQQAIDNATAGDTIHINNGTYHERFVVNKTLTIIGNSTDGVFIEGSGANKDIILVTADRVNITGLSVNNSGYGATCGGITLNGADNCHISGNVLTNNIIGIHITSNSNYNTAEENILKYNQNGFRLLGSNYNKLLNNTILNFNCTVGNGIAIDSSSYNLASGNEIGHCNYAMDFWTGSNNEAHDNLIYNSTRGIHFQSTTNCVAANNTIRNNTYGAYANSGSTNSIYHNSFFTNTNHAYDGGTNI